MRWLCLLAVAVGCLGGAAQKVKAQSWHCSAGWPDVESGVAACTKAIESGLLRIDHLAEAFADRGLMYQRGEQYDSAITDFGHAINTNRYNAETWNERCWAEAIVNRLQLALNDCNESLRLRPNNAPTLDSRGFTYLKLGRLDDAIADYDAALQLSPRQGDSLYGRGVAYLARNDRIHGLADIAAAKAAFPGIADRFRRMGIAEP